MILTVEDTPDVTQGSRNLVCYMPTTSEPLITAAFARVNTYIMNDDAIDESVNKDYQQRPKKCKVSYIVMSFTHTYGWIEAWHPCMLRRNFPLCELCKLGICPI